MPNTQPPTLDEILEQLSAGFIWCEVNLSASTGDDESICRKEEMNKSKQAILRYFADRYIGADRVGIQKGTPEWRSGATCPDCGYAYVGEIGACPCELVSRFQSEQRAKLKEDRLETDANPR